MWRWVYGRSICVMNNELDQVGSPSDLFDNTLSGRVQISSTMLIKVHPTIGPISNLSTLFQNLFGCSHRSVVGFPELTTNLVCTLFTLIQIVNRHGYTLFHLLSHLQQTLRLTRISLLTRETTSLYESPKLEISLSVFFITRVSGNLLNGGELSRVYLPFY